MVVNINANAFQNAIVEFSKTLTYTPVTKTVDNLTGDETLTDGTPISISGAFYLRDRSYTQDIEGLFHGADAIVLVLPSVTISKNAKITYDGETFQIDKVIERKLGTVSFYKVGRLYKRG